MWRKWGLASWHSQPKAEAEAPLLEWSLGEPLDRLLIACFWTHSWVNLAILLSLSNLVG